MSIKNEIENILKENFQPKILEVYDDSYKHKGHVGAGDAVESHFRIDISGADISGDTRLAKHQNVYGVLSELVKKIHALQIIIK